MAGSGSEVTGVAAHSTGSLRLACVGVLEHALRLLGRKNALFAGSDGGARHWAMAMTAISTAKFDDVEPMAYLTNVLECMVSGRTKSHELHSLLPWNWLAATDCNTISWLRSAA